VSGMDTRLESAETAADMAVAAEGHGDYSRAEVLFRNAGELFREARDYGSATEMRTRARTASVAATHR